MNSCFRIIIGQDSAADFLFRLDGWELAVGVIFMWSFVLIVVFVVMNLLISIVSDAYSTIRVRFLILLCIIFAAFTPTNFPQLLAINSRIRMAGP